jgi:hypothetical protein
MDPLEIYLRDIAEIRATGAGVSETSYYPALGNLLNAVGQTLRPRVRSILNLRDRGAGLPDGGFFTADQFRKLRCASHSDPFHGQFPSRGVIEVKGPETSVHKAVNSEQVARYWSAYRLVLVTNYRQFVLLGSDEEGQAKILETYDLAADESTFWAQAVHPLATARRHGERFVEFLRRVMMHNAPIASPQDVACFLASYARDARARIEEADLPALTGIREALQEALGVSFEGAKGDHFFKSTFVQTLFYGVFSAWVLWCRRKEQRLAVRDKSMPAWAVKQKRLPQFEELESASYFDWRKAAWYLRVPMVRALFEQLATPTRLGPLNVQEPLDWTASVLNRVDRTAFFSAFDEGHAVQYFYEPFLHAFDPELRKELGVWYTPTEIVQYMVSRVDSVLRQELGLPDGLADPRVYVLDPCCGTGAYLVETLRRIARTLKEKGDDALLAQDLKRAAMDRVFGFEILPAPFVISHLQLNLLLQNLGAPLSEAKLERVGVYLTNALTGWEPPTKPKDRLLFPELEEERDAAERVKQNVPILVILGNPPYNGFAGVAIDEERDLSNAYRITKRAPAPQGQGLNDLYVRFFRMAERRIVEQTGRGVICFISNYSWLDGLSFTGMRERYLDQFGNLWIDNLHGDRIISEYAPDGRTSETVFAVEGGSPGIKVGTAISLLVAGGNTVAGKREVFYRDLDHARAVERRAALSREPLKYVTLTPVVQLGLPFKPRDLAVDYLSWPLLPALFPVFFPGVKTSRDEGLVDIDRHTLVERMEKYFDPGVSHEEMRRVCPCLVTTTSHFDAIATRSYLLRRGFLPDKVVPYAYRPFDVRWLYWEPETDLLDRKRVEYAAEQLIPQNLWLTAGQRNRKDVFYQPQVTRALADHHLVESNVGMFPLLLAARNDLLSQDYKGPRPNITQMAADYLASLKQGPELLFYHALAVLHSPSYRSENSGALRQDWPRVPLPDSPEVHEASAALGRQVAALLDPETPVPGVTSGNIREELRSIAVISRVGGGALNPDAGDVAVTVGWGHAGKGGVTMPGIGRAIRRDFAPDEPICAGYGSSTFDIYLNEVAYWRNVPSAVWEYTLGGYQVLKKWLSYREMALLGRALTVSEVREVTDIARRIAALLLLSSVLDANYHAVKTNPGRNP